MEPAHSIIERLGGPAAVAKVAGVHRTRVSSWKRPRARGGTGGIIPMRHVAKLLDYAESKGIALTFSDFAPVDDDSREGRCEGHDAAAHIGSEHPRD